MFDRAGIDRRPQRYQYRYDPTVGTLRGLAQTFSKLLELFRRQNVYLYGDVLYMISARGSRREDFNREK